MEGPDPAGPEAEKRSEAEEGDLHFVQNGVITKELTRVDPQQIKRDTDSRRPQRWETPWQAFLKTQTPYLPRKIPELFDPLSGEDTQESRLSFRRVADMNQEHSASHATHNLPDIDGEDCKAYKSMASFVNKKEEAVHVENTISLEMSRWHQETDEAREVFNQL